MAQYSPAKPSADALLEFLRANVAVDTKEEDVAALFKGTGATFTRIAWGGSGRWRQVVRTPDGARAVFEYDEDNRLVGYGAVPAPPDDPPAGAPDGDGLNETVTLVLLEH